MGLNDATIEMNPGVGGDLMDASESDRQDGTTVKRERVVLASDDGTVHGAQAPVFTEDRTLADLVKANTAVLIEIRDLLTALAS